MMKSSLFLFALLLLGSCARQHLASADRDYDRMAYAKATCSYEKALRDLDDRDAALRAADAYVRLNMPAKAVDWFEYADRMEAINAEQALVAGQMLQQLGRNGEAMRRFEQVLASNPRNSIAQELLLAAGDHRSFMADSGLHHVERLALSGMASAFSAVPHMDGIVFVGERDATTTARNPWTGMSFLDIYSTKPTGAMKWSIPTPLPGAVNGRFHEGPFTFSPDGREMYFTRSDYYKFRLNKDETSTSHLVLFRAEMQADGTWGDIHLFAYNGDTFSTGHPALSADGNILYFISDMPGGEGGTDIYRCTRTPQGWSMPENLGRPINTPGNEMFPTMHGDTLFFSSNGHRTMGGLDIFRSELTDQGWSMPQNMNHPINTAQDDFALIMLSEGRKGYLSSNRDGRDAVYAFELHDPVLSVEGMFVDEATGQPLSDVAVRLLDITNGEDIQLLTGPEGSFSFRLRSGTDYMISGTKEGKLNEVREMSTRGQYTSRTYREFIEMHDMEVDRHFVVDNIYYDYDKWEIRPDAAPALNKLADLFMANPDVRFELSSHTDSRASRTYNLLLSEARANSALDYLVRRGMDPDRIVARGYGEEQPVNHCRDGVECSEEEHQANRRTEFRIIGIDGIVQRIRDPKPSQ